jgi:hypothetical protein
MRAQLRISRSHLGGYDHRSGNCNPQTDRPSQTLPGRARHRMPGVTSSMAVCAHET